MNASGRDYFGFIRQTNCPAVIVEGVFVDNATDVQIANTTEKQRAFGYAYARGILTTLGIKPQEASQAVPAGSVYRVQIGAYSQKENAQAQLQRAKEAGFSDAYIA